MFLGCKPDPFDARDRKFGALVPSLSEPPVSASVWDSRCTIKDQRNTSSCVGQAVAQALRLGYLKQGQDCPELSARYVYRGALNVDHERTDDGTHIRSAMRAVQAIGCAPESVFPFSVTKIVDPIALSVAHDGADRWGLPGFYRISFDDVAAVKRAIANGYAVVAGWTVTQGFLDWDGKEPLSAMTGPVRGGHAMAIHSYDGDVFTLANSWSSGWGRAGHALVTSAIIGNGQDVWALDVREAA